MKKMLLIVFTMALLAISPATLFAADAYFSWSPNTETNLAGYKIYCGTASRVYAAPVDVGKGVSVAEKVLGSVPGLTAGQTYYCAATAYDSDGFESLFSSEVSFVASEHVYPVPPAGLQVVIMRRNPDGTVDLLDAAGTVIAIDVKLQ